MAGLGFGHSLRISSALRGSHPGSRSSCAVEQPKQPPGHGFAQRHSAQASAAAKIDDKRCGAPDVEGKTALLIHDAARLLQSLTSADERLFVLFGLMLGLLRLRLLTDDPSPVQPSSQEAAHVSEGISRLLDAVCGCFADVLQPLSSTLGQGHEGHDRAMAQTSIQQNLQTIW